VGEEGRLIPDPATPLEHFPPTLEAARARIAAVRPSDYARSRNALDGAVTRLSPYVTHGLVGLPEVLAGVSARHRIDVQHKFVQELGWREWFRHVWSHHGDGILESMHEGPLPERAYARELPDDVRRARTGVPVIDRAVRTLYATGYLHNHARMWVASYVVHLRKVHWRAGADWMVAHLLDGDLASNHLSWQWVAGTASRKPYLFDAENVARHAPGEWRSEGTVVDTSYGALDAIAHSPRPVPCTPQGEGVDEPALRAAPIDPDATAPRAADVAGRDVWLVHPWALGEPPADLPEGCVRVGWWPTEHHAAWPWSEARWAFTGARMAAIAPVRWHGGGASLGRALAVARSVATWGDPHVSPWLPREVAHRAPARLFGEVDRACGSFSAWWGRCTRGARRVEQLPGLAEALSTRIASST
jgi:deoxyribodipyrimidine photo-lyase